MSSEGASESHGSGRRTSAAVSAELVIKEYGRHARELRISKDQLSLGRDPEADIVLADPAVSRQHARIIKRGEEFLLLDLGSANGTYLNDERVPTEVVQNLHDGDRVRIGRCVLRLIVKLSKEVSSRLIKKSENGSSRLRSEQAAERPRESGGRRPLKKALAALIACDRNRRQRHLIDVDRVTIGRDPACNLRLEDPSVSKLHAEIVLEKDGLYLIDHHSKTGTYLNNESVHVVRIPSHSFLKFGEVPAFFILRDADAESRDAPFGARDLLIELFPERQESIQDAFRACRRGGLDFAEELIFQGSLAPDEWWSAFGKSGSRITRLGESGVSSLAKKLLPWKRRPRES